MKISQEKLDEMQQLYLNWVADPEVPAAKVEQLRRFLIDQEAAQMFDGFPEEEPEEAIEISDDDLGIPKHLQVVHKAS